MFRNNFNPSKTNCLNNSTILTRHCNQTDKLTPNAPVNNMPLNHSEKFISHQIDEVSFLRKQIKSED